MKMILGYISPGSREAVTAALKDLGVRGISMSEAWGWSVRDNTAEQEAWRQPRTRLEVVVSDGEAQQVQTTVAAAVEKGSPGGGLVVCLPVADALRIRTGEVGESAV